MMSREGQRVVDAVVALRHAVADVGREIERGLAARAVGAGLRLLRETQKVRGARVALSVGAFNEDLRLPEILGLPAHAHAQRVHFRRDFADFLTFQHIQPSFRFPMLPL